MNPQDMLVRFAKWILVASGAGLIDLGGYFMFIRSPLLQKDLRDLGLNAAQVETPSPHLRSWQQHVFKVMGGFIAGGRVLIVFVGLRAVPQYVPGRGMAFGCAGLLTVATMSGTNFPLDSDFKWLLLMPVIGWLLGFVCCVFSARSAQAINPLAQETGESTILAPFKAPPSP